MSASPEWTHISPALVKVGINVGILIIIALVIVQAVAGVGQNIASQFPVTNDSGPIYEVYTATGNALKSGAKLIGPLIIVAVAVIVLLVLIYLGRSAT